MFRKDLRNLLTTNIKTAKFPRAVEIICEATENSRKPVGCWKEAELRELASKMINKEAKNLKIFD